MSSLYEQTVVDHGVDPVAETEYAEAVEWVWHYARLHGESLRALDRVGGSKPNLVEDANRRAEKCKVALQKAFELSLLIRPNG